MIGESIYIFGTHRDDEGVALVRDKLLSMAIALDNIGFVTKATLAYQQAIQTTFEANRAAGDAVNKRSLPLLGIDLTPINGVRSFALSLLAIAETEQTKPVGQLVYRHVLIGVICDDPVKVHPLLPMLDPD